MSSSLSKIGRLSAVLMGTFLGATAQTSLSSLNIPRLQQAPTVEDFADMRPGSPLAREMLRVDGFIARLPIDDQPSSEPTEVFLGYDSQNLYAVFLCFDSQPNKMRARRPQRDAIFEDDSITVQLDTFRDQQNAYSFGVNAGGIQGDGVWTEGQGWDLSFDAVYRAEVKQTAQGYIAFLAIPFRSFRFPTADSQHWGIILNRYIARTREDTFWPRYTTRIQGRLNQMGTLNGLADIASGKNLQIVPYFAFVNSKLLNTNPGTPINYKTRSAETRAGLDLKSVWRDKLIFDLTVNPDFSQVESDDPQVLVNQRFEVFFPEKRLFFIENSSYFQTPIQLLFTRRIEKPDAGARITGKLGKYGLGLLLADDRAQGERLPATDPDFGRRAFTNMARVTRDIRPQSFVGGSVVHRRFGDEENIVAGADTRFTIGENWSARAQIVGSHTRNALLAGAWGQASYAGLFEDSRHWKLQLEYSDRSPEFRAETGFIPRVDVRALNSLVQYNFRPEGSALVRWGPLLITENTWDYSGLRLDWLASPGIQFEFKKNTLLDFWAETGGLHLRPIDFSALTANRGYELRNMGGRITSTPMNSLTFDVTFRTRRAVNFFPVAGLAPVSVDSLAHSATVGVRPTRGLTIDTTYLFTQLGDEGSGRSVLNDHVLRSRWLYQFDERWSVRVTAQYNSLLVSPDLTSLQKTKQINGDILIAYRINPATAFFLGYNYDVQNIDRRVIGTTGALARSNTGLLNDGKVLFAKLSYLFRF